MARNVTTQLTMGLGGGGLQYWPFSSMNPSNSSSPKESLASSLSLRGIFIFFLYILAVCTLSF